MFGTLFKVWRYLSAYKSSLALILLMVILSSGLGLLGPYLLGYTIDRIDYPGHYSLIFLLGLLGLVYLLGSITQWLQNIWMIRIAQSAVYRMRNDLFNSMHRLPVAYFSKRQHGELMSRLTNDIDNVSQTLNSSFIQLSSSILTFVGMLGLMLWLSPLLTLITLTIVPAMFFGMKWITNRTGKYFKEQQRHLGDLNGFIEETFSGQKMVKAFSQERRVTELFEEKGARLREAGYWAQTYSGFIPKLMNMLNNASFAIIAGAGGVMAVHEMITVGVIVTFAEYARQFTRPLNDLANQFNTFLSAVAGAERVFEIIEEEPEAKDEANAKAASMVRGEIEFRNVSFAYEKDIQTVSDVSFHLKPGQTAALVGPTGAGKSTIINLLSRFYDPAEGEILLDGLNTRDLTRASLRQQMAFVQQDTFLFQLSIRENIRYGRLDATDEEVERAAELANAHSFIRKLPDGYDTVLDQDGSGISQGQKQLITIARAILADPAILILDEATSSIDTVTELRIQDALYRLMEGRTNIVIAHRLNTVRQADVIIVLVEGQIIESGSHEELMEHKGFYYELVQSQFERVSS
ncbi:ABC transporter ATP-binding protein [Paenibacillus aquistagni]|uniref:ABC transporter ATP-binding protein n=1 Tax=Paenibacillus aquistagni TaxID=1852522 RepID=UPI000B505AB0|nr:ABC transporter ATP-binding protein [Paenibacillus aquistagni]